MENKYYSIGVEDLKFGDDCYAMSSWGLQPGTWPSVLNNDTHTGFANSDDPYKKANDTDLWQKYLDKEDIESLGWICLKEDICPYTGLSKFTFSKEWSQCPLPGMCFDHDYGNYILTFSIRKNFNDFLISLQVSKKGAGGGWCGPYENLLFKSDNYCNVTSINELKFLMKLLNIK